MCSLTMPHVYLQLTCTANSFTRVPVRTLSTLSRIAFSPHLETHQLPNSLSRLLARPLTTSSLLLPRFQALWLPNSLTPSPTIL
jgi:hypothetical protein